MRCGEKWHQGHKCSPALQLHALQEVWDFCEELFSSDDCSETDAPVAADQAYMLLSAIAVSQSFHPRTSQFQGIIQGQPINILLDSGSTNSFLDAKLASSLSGVHKLDTPTTVKVADGGSIPCTDQIQYPEWSIQGYTFHSTLKFIPISTYDPRHGLVTSLFTHEGSLAAALGPDTLWP